MGVVRLLFSKEEECDLSAYLSHKLRFYRKAKSGRLSNKLQRNSVIVHFSFSGVVCFRPLQLMNGLLFCPEYFGALGNHHQV